MMSGNLMQRLRRSNSVEALDDTTRPSSANGEMDEIRREPERIYTRQRFGSLSSTSSSDVDGIVDAVDQTFDNSAVSGAEQQTPKENMTSTGNLVDADRFIERARTHFAQKINFAGAKSHVPKNVVAEGTTLKYEKLEDLFNGTEWQVLYRVTQLIHQRNDLNAIVSDETGDGLLHKAVKNKFVKVAERLLDNGALLDSTNNDKLTPLHLALGQKDDKANKTEEYKLKEAKCDEMAAVIISKLKPCYVRFLFGDDTHFEDSSALEEMRQWGPANKKYGRNARSSPVTNAPSGQDTNSPSGQDTNAPSGQDTNSPSGQDTNAPSGRDSNKGLHYNTFNLLKVVRDKDMQTTTVAILDKLEDVHPRKQKTVVYYKLLTKDKTKKTDTDVKDSDEEEVFQYIARRRPDLINHPAVRAVIHWKWARKFHRRYLFDFMKFFLSFVAITICAVVGAQSDDVQLYDTPWQYVRAALEILTCLFIVESLWSELIQCRVNPEGYVQSILNWIEAGSSVCLIISIGLRYGDVNAHWYMFAVGYVLWTVKGLKYCAIYRHADAYKETLRALIKRDLFLFTVFFVALEMVFGGTLLLVLRGTNALKVEPDTESILSIYYIGLRTMIDGQTPESLNVDNLPRVGEFVIIVFNSLTIVIMLNILIAQLSNTYDKAYQEGQIKSWVNRAEAIVSYEKEDSCKPFGKMHLFGCYCKHSPDRDGTIKFDKEKLLEEKEKVDEMRVILKQVDKTLLHTDLSVQTIKSKQTAANTTDISQRRSGHTRDVAKLEKQLNELKARQEEMKKQQDSLLEAVEEIRDLLQKQE